MATGRKTERPGRGLLGRLESRKNIAGSACGLVGLVLTLTGVAARTGPSWWPGCTGRAR